MPEICRFYGIVIRMFYQEHQPPHFHAQYGEYKAEIRITDLGIHRGGLPPKAMTLVWEWAMKHSDELIDEWNKARSQEPLFPIDPLK